MNIHVEICSAGYERQPVTIEKTVDGCKGGETKTSGHCTHFRSRVMPR